MDIHRTGGIIQNEDGRQLTSAYTTNRLSLQCKFEVIKNYRDLSINSIYWIALVPTESGVSTHHDSKLLI